MGTMRTSKSAVTGRAGLAGLAGLATVALLGAGVSGCSGSAKEDAGTKAAEATESAKPGISAADLQSQLTDRLGGEGMPVDSITCEGELPAEIGASTRCDVQFTETNDVEAIVTATDSEGGYDLTPAMTKAQLEKAVTEMSSAQSAKCTDGIDGTVGASSECDLTTDGTTVTRVVEVTEVDAPTLGLGLSMYAIVPQQQVEELLMQQLGADGQPVETVECVGDGSTKDNATVECVAVSGDQQQGYLVTVSDAAGDVAVEYVPAP